MRKVWGEAADNLFLRGSANNSGELIAALLDAGALAVGPEDQCHAVAVDARGPRVDGGIVTRLDCIPFGIVVNRHGERFYDEGEDLWPRRYALWGRLVARQPQQIAYVLFDAAARRDFMPSVYPPFEGNSIGELARQIDVAAAALAQTVERYNAAVVDGAFDPQALDGCRTEGLTPDKTHWARRLCGPPYYAYPLRCGVTFTYRGVKVDAAARVRFAHGPAVNLFAAGGMHGR